MELPESSAEQRDKLLARLEDDDNLDFFARRLRKCGQPLTLLCTHCGDRRDVFTRCDWKCCPSCQRALAAATADRFARIAQSCVWPLFVTWTSTHRREDGVEWFREFRKAMTKLRAQRWWKQRVKGGVCAYEVSRLNAAERRKYRIKGDDAGWHFHAHMLIDCRWLYVTTLPPRHGASDGERAHRIREINEEVAAQWSMALGRKGSFEVRRVWKDEEGSIGGAVHEVLKYSVKGSDLAESEHDIGPVLWALEKTRLVVPFGSFYRREDCKRRRPPRAMCVLGHDSWIPDFLVKSL